jgi:hypothetical protein
MLALVLSSYSLFPERVPFFGAFFHRFFSLFFHHLYGFIDPASTGNMNVIYSCAET